MSDSILAAVPTSNISLTTASQTFVNGRVTNLGPWVIGSNIDMILLGVVLSQARRYFKSRTPGARGIHVWYMWVVIIATVLSLIKSIQGFAVVWVNCVTFFANPDGGRLLQQNAWYETSTPLATAIIGAFVQSFFCYRYWKLTRGTKSSLLTITIVITMILALIGVSLSEVAIRQNKQKEKIKWFLVHLISVTLADVQITVGTYLALRKNRHGLSQTVSLVDRLTRTVFESAVPPAFVAIVDLIVTQILGAKLIWHLLLNFPLAKLYVISLLYTLNCTNDHRQRTQNPSTTRSNELYSYKNGDMDLGKSTNGDGIRVQTQITTHHDIELSPTSKMNRGRSPLDVQWSDRVGNISRSEHESPTEKRSPTWGV